MNQNMYFNQEMFDCLNRYGNTQNNRHEDEQQQHAYQVLSKAYSVTSLWADSLKNHCFKIDILRYVRAQLIREIIFLIIIGLKFIRKKIAQKN